MSKTWQDYMREAYDKYGEGWLCYICQWFAMDGWGAEQGDPPQVSLNINFFPDKPTPDSRYDGYSPDTKYICLAGYTRFNGWPMLEGIGAPWNSLTRLDKETMEALDE